MAAANVKVDNLFEAPADNPFENVLYYENSDLQKDHQKLQTATNQLKEELEKVKNELTQIYSNLSNVEKSPPRASASTNTDFILSTTAPANEVQDLLSSVIPPPKSTNVFDQTENTTDATLQAKLAKELIKLANSYKVPELTFDIQASK
jgi:seryl-tRNA synthetase